MRKLLILLAACVMVLGTMGVASALTINWSDFVEGQTTASGAGWSASGHSQAWDGLGEFQYKEAENGVGGVGIAGGAVDGEIDWGEKIRIDLDTPAVISEIEISFLYPKGEFNDWVYEAAVIWVFDENWNGVSYSLESLWLQATGTTTADWDGLGSVENVVEADEPNGSLWRLYNNPFGDMEVAHIAFVTPSYAWEGPPGSGNWSDYAFTSLTTAAVPLPGALWLLGSGLVGLVGLRRKFKN